MKFSCEFFAKFLRTLFLQKTSGPLILMDKTTSVSFETNDGFILCDMCYFFSNSIPGKLLAEH